VTNKLRPSASPRTANMDSVVLDNVVETLFHGRTVALSSQAAFRHCLRRGR
jgi:hypothetical protein